VPKGSLFRLSLSYKMDKRGRPGISGAGGMFHLRFGRFKQLAWPRADSMSAGAAHIRERAPTVMIPAIIGYLSG
jgi:hypothetical protein